MIIHLVLFSKSEKVHNTVSYCRDDDSADLKIISTLYKLDSNYLTSDFKF